MHPPDGEVRTGRPAAYLETVERAAARYAALPPDQPVRLAKRTSNLFRGLKEGGRLGRDRSWQPMAPLEA